jgi:hypothetical protein
MKNKKYQNNILSNEEYRKKKNKFDKKKKRLDKKKGGKK